jgi:ABC-type lipoprotein export system ATPase subunit
MSVEIEAGGHTLITGPSGSGKTTLLRLLALLDRADEGTIWYRTVDVSSFANSPQAAQKTADIRIGYVSQDRDLWPHLTVQQNIELALHLKTMSDEDAQDRTAAALHDLGLSAERDKYPSELSGGQRQRCAIARCLVHRPDVLLLDEITAGLDADNIRKVMGAVEVAISQGATVALVSHQEKLPIDIGFSRLEIRP